MSSGNASGRLVLREIPVLRVVRIENTRLGRAYVIVEDPDGDRHRMYVGDDYAISINAKLTDFRTGL